MNLPRVARPGGVTSRVRSSRGRGSLLPSLGGYFTNERTRRSSFASAAARASSSPGLSASDARSARTGPGSGAREIRGSGDMGRRGECGSAGVARRRRARRCRQPGGHLVGCRRWLVRVVGGDVRREPGEQHRLDGTTAVRSGHREQPAEDLEVVGAGRVEVQAAIDRATHLSRSRKACHATSARLRIPPAVHMPARPGHHLPETLSRPCNG